jgi:hypothetical protein
MTRKLLAAALGTTIAIPAALANPDTPMLHPVEAVCIDYEQSGQMQSGTSTRCHRDFGYEQYGCCQSNANQSPASNGVGGFIQPKAGAIHRGRRFSSI